MASKRPRCSDRQSNSMFKWHKVEASAGPRAPSPHAAEGTKEQSKGEGDQGQFSCAFTATPLQWHRVGAGQVHLQAWTTLQRTAEIWTVRLLNFNKLMKNTKFLNGSKVLPSVDEVTLCWYTGNSWLILQDEQFTRGKKLSGKMINIVMRKSEARIHNVTFTSHKRTEISSWSPGHRSKWDTDKYKYMGSPPRQNNHLLFGRGTKNFTVYPCRWDYRTFNLLLPPHNSYWENTVNCGNCSRKGEKTTQIFYVMPGTTHVLLKITLSHFFLKGLLFSCCRRKQKPTF